MTRGRGGRRRGGRERREREGGGGRGREGEKGEKGVGRGGGKEEGVREEGEGGWRREVERSEKGDSHVDKWMQNGRIDFLLLSAPLVSTKSPQDCHTLEQRTASYHTTKCSCA